MFRAAQRYGLPNTLDRIKFIALVIMTIDHLGYFVFTDVIALRAIGRITVPVWFFLVGYYTANAQAGDWKRYAKKWPVYFLYTFLMMVMKFATSAPIFPLAALSSMFVCQAMLLLPWVRNRLQDKPFEIPVLIVFFFPTILFFEYGSQGLLFAVVGYLVQKKQFRWETGATALLAYALYCGIQNVTFNYGMFWQWFVILGTAMVMWALMTIEKQEWKFAINYPVFGAVACTLSRYSLHYYFFHFIIIQMIGCWLHPPKTFFLLRFLG